QIRSNAVAGYLVNGLDGLTTYTELPRRRGVGGQSVQSVHQVARDRVGSNLRVIHSVAAANREARTAPRMPAEASARREVLLGVGQSLMVVTKPEIDSEIAAHVDAVLHKAGIEPLLQLVAADSEVDGLRVL